jgi:PsbP
VLPVYGGTLLYHEALLQHVSSNDTSAADVNATITPSPSPLAGIQIAYPNEWLVNDLGNGTVRFSSPLRTDLMRFTVNVVNLPSSMENMTLDNIVNLNLNTSRQLLSNFSLIESNATTISSENQSAYKIVYTNTNKDPKFPLNFKTMQVFAIKDGQLYTLSYVSEASQYGRYLPTIENMIDSITFTDDTVLQTTENDEFKFGPNIIWM